MVGALSGTILLESCTNGYYLNYDVDDINETLSKSSTVFNNKALPINVTFSDEQREYLIFLQTLAQDILSDSSTAKSFISNPQEYVQSKGFTCEINIDSKLTQIILALADDEICKAIESGDISTYLNLLKRKGLIDNISISELNQLKDYTSTLNKAMNMSRAANQEMVSASFFAFCSSCLSRCCSCSLGCGNRTFWSCKCCCRCNSHSMESRCCYKWIFDKNSFRCNNDNKSHENLGFKISRSKFHLFGSRPIHF